MPSLLAWLDTTEEEQRLSRELMAMFVEPEGRDELGIGQVRDAFSDLLFPGTTTLLRRARYYLIVPTIERHVAPYPLSSDGPRYQRVKEDVALYRLTFGQPRQEDVLALLKDSNVSAASAEALRVRLVPSPDMDRNHHLASTLSGLIYRRLDLGLANKRELSTSSPRARAGTASRAHT